MSCDADVNTSKMQDYDFCAQLLRGGMPVLRLNRLGFAMVLQCGVGFYGEMVGWM